VDAGALEAACFGVAGPVKHRRAQLTNVPWDVDANAICRQLPVARVDLINDLEALAWCVPVLDSSETEVLWPGDPDPGGGAALIAAGTGLGVALLPKVAGRFVPLPSEGGHTDFAARSNSAAQSSSRCSPDLDSSTSIDSSIRTPAPISRAQRRTRCPN
jgi:glucokinase